MSKQVEMEMKKYEDYNLKYKFLNARPDILCELIELWEKKGYHMVPGMMSQGNGGPNILMERD